MIVTVLEGHVPAGREAALQDAYQSASAELPPGLVHSELLRDARDPARWFIQSWWESREVLDAMRSAGTPAGILMFRAAGSEPTLDVFELVDAIPRD